MKQDRQYQRQIQRPVTGQLTAEQEEAINVQIDQAIEDGYHHHGDRR